MKTILLKFSGPLQSWGTDSHFNIRKTDRYPSKSAVIGLLAACLGIRRNENDKMAVLRQLSFAVRVDQQGEILRDLQVVRSLWLEDPLIVDKLVLQQTDINKNSYLTQRYYLEDAVFVVAISHHDEAFIDELVRALKAPYFAPAMGRRSCPLPMDYLLGVFEDDPIGALKNLSWQVSFYRGKPPKLLDVYADAHLIPEKRPSYRRDQLISFSDLERKYLMRPEVHIQVPLIIKMVKTDHDAFGAIGGKNVSL